MINKAPTVPSRNYGLPEEADHLCTIYYDGVRDIHSALGTEKKKQLALPAELEETL